MWTNFNSSDPGKLHLVTADIFNDTSEQLNGSLWRRKFNPNLTYYIATDTMLGNTFHQYGGDFYCLDLTESHYGKADSWLSGFANANSAAVVAEKPHRLFYQEDYFDLTRTAEPLQ